MWLPKNHLDQVKDQWNEFETEPEPIERLSGFFSALATTTINWSDATLARLPGVRERVVRIGLPSGVGGLNIRMKEEKIRELADLGSEAAVELLKRYALPAPRPPGIVADGWNEHRWVRLNVLRDSLSRSLAGLNWAALQGSYGKPLRDLIRQAIDEPILNKGDDESVPKDNDSQLLAAQAAALEGVLDALMQAERALNMPTVGQPYTPSPRPVMRVRPPLSEFNCRDQERGAAMQIDVQNKSKSLLGVTDLTLTAPLKSGLIPALDSRGYETRVRTLLKTLNALRISSLEAEQTPLIADAVDRIRALHSFRLAIVGEDPQKRLLLSVAFDGGWEPYMRRIWRDLGPLLDVIFCNCEGYLTVSQPHFPRVRGLGPLGAGRDRFLLQRQFADRERPALPARQGRERPPFKGAATLQRN